MNGSEFGNIFKITTFGESHGPAIGAIIDGVPSGIDLCEEDFSYYMQQRKPQKENETNRVECDFVKILSGVFEGKTTGTPIALMIENNNTKSSDYEDIKNVYRPGHADFTYDAKYGFRDFRGGGRSSGRETATRVACGVVARKILDRLNIQIESEFVYKEIEDNTDSSGGFVNLSIKNVPAGLGEPVFNKLDAMLSHAIMSVGAVKAIEFGDGLKVTEMTGSEFNDEFYIDNGKVYTKTNHCGGILGGISTGGEIRIKAFIKPTPSISQKQNTVNSDLQETTIEIKGRHDKCIVRRVSYVLEAMTAIVLADALLMNATQKIENILKIYKDK